MPVDEKGLQSASRRRWLERLKIEARTTATPDKPVLHCEPLLLDGPAVCELLSIGLSTLYAMDRSGELGPTGLKLRGRRLWPRRELSAWVDAGCPHREKWLGLWERRQSA